MTFWSSIALKEICHFISGGTPSRKVPEYFLGTIPWITGADVDANVITRARDYITEDAIQNSATNIVPEGSILLVTRTGVGKVAIAGTDICISQDLTGLALDSSKVNRWYLFYFLLSKQSYLSNQERGATIQGITRDIVENLCIPLPPLSDQHRIAAILQKADRLRHLRRYARQLSDGYLHSVFLEMFGDPTTNPKGWNIVLLRDLVRPKDKINYGVVQPGSNFPGGVPIIRVGDFDDIPENTNGLKRIDPKIESEYKKSRLRGDELLIACVGSIGKILLVDERLKGFNIVRATARVPVGNLINRLFLAEYLQTEYIQNYFIKETRTVSQPTLNIEHIEAIPVPVPPMAEQEHFVRKANRFSNYKTKQRESEHQTEMLYHSLLERAFQGEL